MALLGSCDLWRVWWGEARLYNGSSVAAVKACDNMIIPAKSQAFISCKPKCKIAVRGSHLAMPTAVFAMQRVQSQQQDSSSESPDSPDSDSDSEFRWVRSRSQVPQKPCQAPLRQASQGFQLPVWVTTWAHVTWALRKHKKWPRFERQRGGWFRRTAIHTAVVSGQNKCWK